MFFFLFFFFIFFFYFSCCCCCCRLFVSSDFLSFSLCFLHLCSIHTLFSIAPENRFEHWNWPNCGSYRIVICFEFDLFFRTLFIIYNANQKLMIERLFFLFCFVSLLALTYKQNTTKKNYKLIVYVCYLKKHVLRVLQHHNLANIYTSYCIVFFFALPFYWSETVLELITFKEEEEEKNSKMYADVYEPK